MGWKSDITKALWECNVPTALHQEVIDSLTEAKQINRKRSVKAWLAPIATIPLLWGLPREAEQLAKKNDYYGNEACNGTGMNGDKRAWIPYAEYDTLQGLLRKTADPSGPNPAPMESTYDDWQTVKWEDGHWYGQLVKKNSSDQVYWGYGWVKKLYKLCGGEIHPRNNFCRWLFIGLRNRASMFGYLAGPEATSDTQSYGNATNEMHNPGEGFFRMGNHWQYRSHKKLFKFAGYTWYLRKNLGYKINNVVANEADRAMVTFTTFSIKGDK